MLAHGDDDRWSYIYAMGRALAADQKDFLTMRVGNIYDAIDKDMFSKDFSKVVSESRYLNQNVRFHGCSLTSAYEILESHGISSSADRNPYGYRTSSDFSGEFSVTKPNEIGTSVGANNHAQDYSHLRNNLSAPGGCVFMLMSEPTQEHIHYQSVLGLEEVTKMHNVSFDHEPNKFIGIITTQDNVDLVNEWCMNLGYPPLARSQADFAQDLAGLDLSLNLQQAVEFMAEEIGKSHDEFIVNLETERIYWDPALGDPSGMTPHTSIEVGTLDDKGQLIACVSGNDFHKWAKENGLDEREAEWDHDFVE